jgi:hypothetical protein
MLISQYAFTLPADYPMRAIRDRIAARGPQFDTCAGLGWKAFLVRDREVPGATDQQYAPHYLWPSAGAAAEFFAGPLFASVSDAFGRPRVMTSLLLRHQLDSPAQNPRWCTSEHQPVPSLAILHAHIAAFEARSTHARHSAWLALDASRWVLSSHQFWCGDDPPSAKHAPLYEVAHFSQPA